MESVEGGPFTSLELNRLSLVRSDAWSAVEGETIVSLTSMLQLHVGSGVSVDLVGEGREVVKMRKEEGGPVISVQQVRF